MVRPSVAPNRVYPGWLITRTGQSPGEIDLWVQVFILFFFASVSPNLMESFPGWNTAQSCIYPLTLAARVAFRTNATFVT